MWEAIAAGVISILATLIPAVIKNWSLSVDEKQKLLTAFNSFRDAWNVSRTTSENKRKTAQDQIDRLNNNGNG